MKHPRFIHISAAGGDVDTFPYIAGLARNGSVWVYFVTAHGNPWIEITDEGTPIRFSPTRMKGITK